MRFIKILTANINGILTAISEEIIYEQVEINLKKLQ